MGKKSKVKKAKKLQKQDQTLMNPEETRKEK